MRAAYVTKEHLQQLCVSSRVLIRIADMSTVWLASTCDVCVDEPRWQLKWWRPVAAHPFLATKHKPSENCLSSRYVADLPSEYMVSVLPIPAGMTIEQAIQEQLVEESM